MTKAGQHGPEAGVVLGLACRGERTQSTAMKRVNRAEDFDPGGLPARLLVLAHGLDRRLVRLGAGVTEKHTLSEAVRRQPLGQIDRRLVVIVVGDVPQLAQLGLHRRPYRRVVVTKAQRRHAPQPVDELAAVGVPDARTEPAHKGQRCRLVVGEKHLLRAFHERGVRHARPPDGPAGQRAGLWHKTEPFRRPEDERRPAGMRLASPAVR